MTARILPFPARGPFTIRIEREDAAWLVIDRAYAWAFGSRRAARAAAENIASGWGVAIVEARQ